MYCSSKFTAGYIGSLEKQNQIRIHGKSMVKISVLRGALQKLNHILERVRIEDFISSTLSNTVKIKIGDGIFSVCSVILKKSPFLLYFLVKIAFRTFRTWASGLFVEVVLGAVSIFYTPPILASLYWQVFSQSD